MTSARAELQRLFIGTYTNTTAKGIYAATFDPATGQLSAPELAAEVGSPSFLAVTPDRRALYAVSEPTKAVHAYTLDAASGTLTKLNDLPSGGGGPCDVAVDATGRTVAIANYGGGSTVSYRLADDGSLAAQTSLDQHTHASAAHPNRQKAPHAHGVTFSPDNRLLVSPDLGGDRVYLYDHDPVTSAITPRASQPWLELAPASGPRHAQFSPDGRQLYIINELDNTLAVAAVNAATGTLAIVQTLPTLPPDFTGNSTTAEVAVSANGRNVYGSNRGHDSIAVYARDPADGTLALRQIVPTGGKHPRHFALSPDGGWLLCANMESDDITLFRIDPATGELTPSDQPPVALARPVCLRFL
ncbi:MAG: lactonase family protein [Verrucomicrobiota bacterium]